MFYRFITAWLMLSILGYGMALAADVHNETTRAVETEYHAQVMPAEDSQPDPLGATVDSDHCLHGIAHLLGFTSPVLTPTAIPSSLPVACHSADFHSLSQPPAFRPPISL